MLPAPRIRIEQLRSFLALAEEGHFRRAALKLNLSQPALTLQIKTLEAELGTTLIIRGKRRSTLTQAGREFLREATLALRHVDLAAARARAATSGSTGRLSLGFSSDHYHGLTPRSLASFRRKYGDIAIEASYGASPDLIRSVSENRLDLAFISAPSEASSRELTSMDLPPTRIVAVLPRTHPLASKRRIKLAALAAEQFVLPPLVGWTAFYRQIARLFEDAGFEPRVAFEVLDTTMLISLVAAGDLVALAALDSVPRKVAGVTYVELEGSAAAVPLAAIWRPSNQSAVLANFVAHLANRVDGERQSGAEVQHR